MIGLTNSQAYLKRAFDFTLSFLALLCLFPLILILFLLACLDTQSFGFFCQQRIGLHGKPFVIIKLKTMRDVSKVSSPISSFNTSRITTLGQIFRKYKLDELPQLFNILIGQMSFVGPRPDVPGYADCLNSERELYLSVRPGVTGPASIKYADEEAMLSMYADPQQFNDEVIWPDKVRINLEYIRNWSFRQDLSYIFKTVFR